MDRLLSRQLFMECVADGLGLTPWDLETQLSGGVGLDPVALHRLDEIVSTQLGVELPEAILVRTSDIDAIYRAYVLARVGDDLDGSRAPGRAT